VLIRPRTLVLVPSLNPFRQEFANCDNQILGSFLRPFDLFPGLVAEYGLLVLGFVLLEHRNEVSLIMVVANLVEPVIPGFFLDAINFRQDNYMSQSYPQLKM